MQDGQNDIVMPFLECEPGDLRLYNERPTGSNGVVGIPQRCIDGVWVALCDDGTNSQDGVERICQTLGYDGQYYYALYFSFLRTMIVL